MKNVVIALCLLFTYVTCYGSVPKKFDSVRVREDMKVGSADDPDASAILDLESLVAGFLAPRMDTTARDNISNPATGLLIYNTSDNELNFYNGTVWSAIGSSGGATAALDNLASVQINSSLLFDTDNTYDIGTAAVSANEIFTESLKGGTGGDLIIEAPSANSLVLQAPIIQFKDSSGDDAGTIVADGGGPWTLQGVTSDGSGSAQSLEIFAGEGSGPNDNGGQVDITGGAGEGTGDGGNLNFTAGAANGFGTGGDISLTTGAAGGGDGNLVLHAVANGQIILQSDTTKFQTHLGDTIGTIVEDSGFSIKATDGDGSDNSKALNLQAGNGGSSNDSGGALSFNGGSSEGNGNAGGIELNGGSANGSGGGGGIDLVSGTGSAFAGDIRIHTAVNGEFVLQGNGVFFETETGTRFGNILDDGGMTLHPQDGSGIGDSVALKLEGGDGGGGNDAGGNVDILSGDGEGTGNGGAITLQTGNPNGSGVRGGLFLKNGTEGTIGHVLTSLSTDGEAGWSEPAISGATTALDNLSSVQINESLIPDSHNNHNLGDGSTSWSNVYTAMVTGINGTGSDDSQSISINAGSGQGASNDNGGGIDIAGGTGEGNGEGGTLSIQGGNSNGSAAGGNLNLSGGNGDGSGDGGSVIISGGTGGNPGEVKIAVGTGSYTMEANVQFWRDGAGNDVGSVSHNSSDLTIQAQGGSGADDSYALILAGGNGAATNDSGGELTIKSGSAEGTGNGGNINITAGDANGSGIKGKVLIDSLLVDANSGIKSGLVTADPCGDTTAYPEATLFYNDTSDYYCFCNGAGDDVQMHSPATACF